MNQTISIFILFLLLPFYSYATLPLNKAATEQAPLFLEVGEQRLIHFHQIFRFSMSGSSIRYHRLSEQNTLLIKAIRPGISNLTLFTSPSESQTRLIRVEPKKSNLHKPELLQAINALDETEVLDAGEHFILRGNIRSLKEASGVAYLREHFSKWILDETKIEPTWFEKNKNELGKLLQSYPTLDFIAEAGLLFVSGALSHSSQATELIKKIKAIQPLTQVDIQSISDSAPTIYFKVFLLEVKKEQMGSLGLEWPESHGAALKVSPLQLLLNHQLDLTIHALSKKGSLKILSSPELVVRAPGQAEVFAGGELPIRQRSKFTDSVIWKPFGLSLKLDIKEFGGEKVRLNIETEISHLDRADSNDEIPAIQSNRIKTQVDGILGKPLLLSGLLQEGMRSTLKGLPWLSSLPILGTLFSSEDFQNDRSELVAVLLPRRIPPENPMNHFDLDSPKGFLPPARHPLSPEEIANLKNNPAYPWNVL